MSIMLTLFVATDAFAQDKQDKKKGKETVKFYVEDMVCENCQAKVEKNIAFEKGVTDLKCTLSDKTVEVTYKTDKTNPENLKKGFKKFGMTAVESDSIKVNKTDLER
ncbi:MAG: heavy-metal-associated domain-containing protein [Dysgonamonadaceae bacterium]|jgi:copper chaperone CopZ|nr:heavy-metal-associated domain-containing protein [Dysgonamonadaceae bacterium]